LNAADEIAVAAFLRGEIGFASIAAVVEETLGRVPNRQPRTVAEILEIDRESRSTAGAIARQLAARQTAAAQPVPVRV
jgi:1-deoxy-D-xylulose-5-phosphate reductoisomerase